MIHALSVTRKRNCTYPHFVLGYSELQGLCRENVLREIEWISSRNPSIFQVSFRTKSEERYTLHAKFNKQRKTYILAVLNDESTLAHQSQTAPTHGLQRLFTLFCSAFTKHAVFHVLLLARLSFYATPLPSTITRSQHHCQAQSQDHNTIAKHNHKITRKKLSCPISLQLEDVYAGDREYNATLKVSTSISLYQTALHPTLDSSPNPLHSTWALTLVFAGCDCRAKRTQQWL